MSRHFVIIILVLLSSSFALAQGNSTGTAVAIGPNVSVTGSINDQSTQHYWKVTTTANGYLRLQVTSGTTIDVDLVIYDTNGTTQMSSDGRSGIYSEVYGFLKPGTYYIRVYRWTGTSGSYTLTSTFSSPTRSVDSETNDSYQAALALNPGGGVSTGHLGYFGNGTTDTEDYWKITTTEDGWLRVQVRSDSLDMRADDYFDVDLVFYDVNGTTNVTSDGRSGTFSQVSCFVRPGTYYVRVYRWHGRGASYEIKSEFFTPTLANDPNPNETYQTASTVSVNGSATGHLGYFSNGTTDTDDYWKFTTTADGRVTVRVVSDSLDRSGARYDLDLVFYDVNGTTNITSDGRSGTLSEVILHLRPGTYYARVYRWSGNAASYNLSVAFTPPTRANDVEGNDWFAAATPLTLNSAATGHIGYFSNNTTDSQDYWRLVASSADSIYLHVSSDSTLDLDVVFYGPDTTFSILSDGRSGIYSRIGFKPASGSAYYFRVYRWQGSAGAYSIIANRSYIPVSVEKTDKELIAPTEFSLGQNYPNPFNPSTTVRFSLPQASDVRVSVYTMLGQEVAVLVNGTLPAAEHTTTWNGRGADGSEMPSGMYLIRLQTGSRQIVRKAMLLR